MEWFVRLLGVLNPIHSASLAGPGAPWLRGSSWPFLGEANIQLQSKPLKETRPAQGEGERVSKGKEVEEQ